MMRLIVGLLIIFKINMAIAEDKTIFSQQLSVFTKILKNNPTIDRKKAEQISKSIVLVCRKYKIPYDLYTAILMQESAYRVSAKNCKNNKCFDYGISQINIKNIKHYNLSIQKLTSDLEYSIEAGAIVLAFFKNAYSHKEVDWWTRYNASSPKKRLEYKKKVSRFL